MQTHCTAYTIQDMLTCDNTMSNNVEPRQDSCCDVNMFTSEVSKLYPSTTPCCYYIHRHMCKGHYVITVADLVNHNSIIYSISHQ